MKRRGFYAAVAAAIAITSVVHGQSPAGRSDSTDAIARLGDRLASGDATIDFRQGAGYLPSLLEHLGINIDSQVLVFSKTSFQHALINPKNPRALYFNDNVAVGMVPGGSVYEIVALEPSHGLAFYSLDTRKVERPVFQRRGVECLFCHGPGNKGAAALVAASVIPDAMGTPAYTSAFIETIDHRTPFDRRWGGWFVTGTHGAERHMGNAVAADPEHPTDLETTGTQNLTSLDRKTDVSKYLTGTSDIVALLTLDHQVGMVNRLGAVGVQYRAAERSSVSDKDRRHLESEVRDLVDYMLFVDEAPLGAPVAGVSTFTRTFPQGGPRDDHGHSLRDLDLQTRLFRYRLSYMIYSDLFDTLPRVVRDQVYARLREVLTGKDTNPRYASRPQAENDAILHIVRTTKASVPAGW